MLNQTLRRCDAGPTVIAPCRAGMIHRRNQEFSLSSVCASVPGSLSLPAPPLHLPAATTTTALWSSCKVCQWQIDPVNQMCGSPGVAQPLRRTGNIDSRRHMQQYPDHAHPCRTISPLLSHLRSICPLIEWRELVHPDSEAPISPALPPLRFFSYLSSFCLSLRTSLSRLHPPCSRTIS